MTPDAARAILLDSPPAQILVVQTAFLGDVVFTSPLIQALDDRYPSSFITMVVSPRGAVVGRHIPGVDAVVVFDKRGADRGPLALWHLARSLHPDLAVVAHPSWRSALLARWSKPRISVGSAGGLRGALFDVAVATPGGFVAAQLELALAVGATRRSPLRLVVGGEELLAARERLGSGRFVGAVVGSEWATKRLPPARWGSTLDTMIERGFTPVLLGAPSEKSLAHEILAACRGRSSVIDQVGDSLDLALATLGCCEVVVGGDTGLVHASRALGIPVVALFGPTDPQRHQWETSSRVITRNLACQPCHAHGPSRCPLGHHDCMRTLSPADIAAAAVEVARPLAAS